MKHLMNWEDCPGGILTDFEEGPHPSPKEEKSFNSTCPNNLSQGQSTFL